LGLDLNIRIGARAWSVLRADSWTSRNNNRSIDFLKSYHPNTFKEINYRSRAFTQVIDEDWRIETDIGTRAGLVLSTPKRFEVSFFRGERFLYL
jgi:hypothetical protein